MTLLELFNRFFAGRASAEALEFRGVTLTFGDLERRANQTAHLLLSRGLRPGDRLAVYLENRIECIDLFLACAKTGIVLVPINILYRAREIGHIVSDAEPRAVVSAGPLPGGGDHWRVDELSAARSLPAGPPDSTPGAASPLAIVYTSGTTGTAKGAILSHGNFAANTVNLLNAWRITGEDRLLLPLPLFHLHGLGNGVCCWLASGCRMRLLERFDHARAAEEFLGFKPTLFFGVPTIYVRLLGLPEDVARQIGASMRLFVSGSAPLPAAVFEEFRARFGHAILERYGMTETFMNTANPYEGERRPSTVGPPLPGVDVRVMTAGGALAEPGEAGEVQVRGDNVFAGYWRREQATREAFADGWFRTGDIGDLSADGYLTLRGRASDLIISGGFNIYPREIEEEMLDAPGVREAVVIGAPDPVRGEVPVAYLVVGDDFDESALIDRLRSSLASFKMPRAFVRMDALPRTALGKIQRHLLPPWTG